MTLVELDSSRVHVHSPAAVDLRLSSLPVGHPWRPDGISDAHVAQLASVHSGWTPILVNRRDMTVVDGAHRVAAARRLGAHSIVAEWFDGTMLDAFHEFVVRNTRGGLPLSAQDREAGVVRALAAEASWSDRRIAQLCGVSPKMVARLRCDRTSTDGECVKRVGRDGRARPVRAGAMRQQISDALEQDPDASLRTIAARLGVSPETVRSVRKELDGHSRGIGTDEAFSFHERDITADYFTSHFGRQQAAPWREDNAFQATSEGESFVEWFEAKAVAPGLHHVEDVPLSRVYEIADEARHRAAFWTKFADSLEMRTRRRR